jgi:6,7-dimethyl-8-ribityllumazine synthase
MSVRGSDHKPVVALFNMKVKDGVDEAAERLVDEVVQALGVAEDQIDCVVLPGALQP